MAQFISNKDQLADALTKPLLPVKFRQVQLNVITLFWVIPPNLPKNKKIKGVVVGKKIQGGNFGCFQDLDYTSLMPKNEGKCRFKANVIYYWINMHRN